MRRGPHRLHGAAALLVAATLTLSGCAGDDPTPAVEIGDLPADTGGAIPLGEEYDEFDTFASWPSACDLVTDETLQALLPQTEQVTRTPESVSYEFQAPDLTAVPGGITVPEALCDVALDIPIGMLEDGGTATVHLEVLMAGSPEMVELNADPNIADGTELELEGGTCAETVFGISCVNATGQIAFRVSFELPHHGPSLKDPSRYVHDGEEVSFTTNAEDDEARQAYIEDNLTYPMVESILARLSG